MELQSKFHDENSPELTTRSSKVQKKHNDVTMFPLTGIFNRQLSSRFSMSLEAEK